jgi:hypothetical protein
METVLDAKIAPSSPVQPVWFNKYPQEPADVQIVRDYANQATSTYPVSDRQLEYLFCKTFKRSYGK